METKKREKFYWYICLLFILLSPILIYNGLNNTMRFGYNPAYYIIGLLVGHIAVFPLEAVRLLLKGEKYDLKMGAKYPKYNFETTTGMVSEQAVEEIKHRLIGIGFSVNEKKESDSNSVLEFKKNKKDPVNSIMDHAIWGSVRVEKKFSNPAVKAEVIFGDTLVMDSGESDAMNTLARYISLAEEDFLCYSINLTLITGTMLSFITNVLLHLHYSGVQRFEPSIFFSAALGAISLIVIGLYFNFKNREYLIGTRVGIAGLYISLVTFIPVIHAFI